MLGNRNDLSSRCSIEHLIRVKEEFGLWGKRLSRSREEKEKERAAGTGKTEKTNAAAAMMKRRAD